MRVFPNMFGDLRLPAEGGYGQDQKGHWWMRYPGQNAVKLPHRDVIPGSGDTITVSGFIIAGAWTRSPTP